MLGGARKASMCLVLIGFGTATTLLSLYVILATSSLDASVVIILALFAGLGVIMIAIGLAVGIRRFWLSSDERSAIVVVQKRAAK